MVSISCRRILYLPHSYHFPQLFPSKYIFTVRKRSLGQGNVFAGVCLLRGASLMSLPVWLPGSMFLQGVSLSWGFSVRKRGGGDSLSSRGVLCPGCLHTETYRIGEVGGTHPTGMLSYLNALINFSCNYIFVKFGNQ